MRTSYRREQALAKQKRQLRPGPAVRGYAAAVQKRGARKWRGMAATRHAGAVGDSPSFANTGDCRWGRFAKRPYETLGGDAATQISSQIQAKSAKLSATPRREFQALHLAG